MSAAPEPETRRWRVGTRLAAAAGMFHYVARSRTGSVLFRTWEEGTRLFAILARSFPEWLGACVMPDHLHLLLPHGEGTRRLGAAMSAYARWRNAHRRTVGVSVWEPSLTPEVVEPDKQARTLRYVHLNPCRKRLVNDPLSWPLSTHRDMLGLSAPSGRLLHPNPVSFHAYVSGDPSVDPGGTSLPEIQYGRFDFLAIRDAVSAVTRTLVDPPPLGVVRSLLVRTASAHRLFEPGGIGTAGLADILGMSQSQVQRIAKGTPSRNAPIRDRALAAAVRVVGDGRFGPLSGGDLLRSAGWGPYRWKR